MSSYRETMAMERMRSVIQHEINMNCYKSFSFEHYKKTDEEKVRLKVAKAEHKEYVKAMEGILFS